MDKSECISGCVGATTSYYIHCHGHKIIRHSCQYLKKRAVVSSTRSLTTVTFAFSDAQIN